MPTHARTPQPPLPPATASSPATHRRQRTFSSASSSSSTSSSLSTASSAASSPSPSPRGRSGAAASGTRSSSTTTTSVPFSWEHHPGIPKTRFPASSPPTAAPLPLPPPLRAPLPSAARRGHHHRRRATPPSAADPFAAALAECTRERSSDAGLMDSLFPASPAPPIRRRWSIAAAAGSGGFLDLYGCKNAMAVAEGAFILRRPVAVARPGHGRPGRAGRR